MSEGGVIRVVIVDDHPLMREGLRALVASVPDIEIVGEAADGSTARKEVQLARADVVVMDLNMPGMNGVDATREILAALPDARILVLTMLDDDESVFAAMRAGARGYLLKGSHQDEILQAVRTVASDHAVFGPGVAARIIDFFTTAPRSVVEPASVLPELSAREIEVLDRIASGRANPQIARDLFISPKTLSNHISSIFAKLRVADRAEAIQRARDAGLGGG